MGIGMPKFITTTCTSVKETYYSFKSQCNGLKETFKFAKQAYNIAKNLDINAELGENADPQDVLSAINASKKNLPESYRKILEIIPEDTLKSVTSLLFNSLTKRQGQGHGASGAAAPEDQQDPTKDQQKRAEPMAPDIFSEKGLSDTIGRMTDAMADQLGHKSPEEVSQPPPTQEEYIDPPEQKGYSPGYSEMKSDDDRDARPSPFDDDNVEEDSERRNSPFAMEDLKIDHTPGQEEEEPYNRDDTYTIRPEGGTNHRQHTEDDFPFQNQSAGPHQENKKELPRMSKMLDEELRKRFGSDWRNRVPPFVNHPETEANLPDLGFGLGKERNRDMIITMSHVLKDLM